MEHNRENLSRQNGWKRAPFSEKTGMWVCPICGQIKPLEQPCVRCGFDMRTDFLNLRTIAPVPQDDAKKRQVCVSDEKVRSEQERQERERKAREEREREERERKAREEREREERERKAREERERQERERKAREERERLERERKEKKEQERREREEKRKSRMQMIIPQLGRMAEQKEKKEQEELEWQQKLLQQAREDRERLTRERKAREEQERLKQKKEAEGKQESLNEPKGAKEERERRERVRKSYEVLEIQLSTLEEMINKRWKWLIVFLPIVIVSFIMAFHSRIDAALSFSGVLLLTEIILALIQLVQCQIYKRWPSGMWEEQERCRQLEVLEKKIKNKWKWLAGLVPATVLCVAYSSDSSSFLFFCGEVSGFAAFIIFISQAINLGIRKRLKAVEKGCGNGIR